jgi:hypothetical protein
MAPLAFAQQQTGNSLAPADQKALQQTQEVLTDKSKRKDALTTDAAKKADAYATSVGGNHTDDIYSLASKVFEKLVIKYNGDSNKIAEVLERAKKDPASFANSEFSSEELKALKELAGKLPAASPSAK